MWRSRILRQHRETAAYPLTGFRQPEVVGLSISIRCGYAPACHPTAAEHENGATEAAPTSNDGIPTGAARNLACIGGEAEADDRCGGVVVHKDGNPTADP